MKVAVLQVNCTTKKRNVFERLFPDLLESGYKVTSPQMKVPNCISWALGDTAHFWQGGAPTKGYYWPPNIPQDDSLVSWVMLFEFYGYQVTDSAELEPGVEKVAIYASSEEAPEHVARQKSSGKWTSKIGRGEDIEHDYLEGLKGDFFGTVVCIMGKPRQGEGVMPG